eukprot:g1507.t1
MSSKNKDIVDVTERRGHRTFGMVFDLDGVVYRSGPFGKKIVGHSDIAIKKLRDEKIPFAFVTNSTGVTEKEKASMLSKLLNMDISEDQVFMATSPVRTLAKKYVGKPVLVLGNGNEASLARAFGLTDFVTLDQFIAMRPQLLPSLFKRKMKEGGEDRKKAALDVSGTSCETRKIAAIFVLTDPMIYYHSAIQIVLDLVGSNGEPVVALGGGASESAQDVDLYFSNPDISYPTTHTVPRMTQGSFRLCLEALYPKFYGSDKKLRYKSLGKPFPQVYDCAKESLTAQWRRRCGGTLDRDFRFDRIYMVGDNPRSDIKGANAMGWESVLVRTGKFPKDQENDATNPAKHVVAGAIDAVRLAMEGIR